MIFYAVFGIFPFLFTFYVSLTNWDVLRGTNEFVGLANYAALFTTDIRFVRSILNTLFFMAVSIPVMLGLGLLIAYTLHRDNGRLRRFLQTATFLPYVTIPVAIGFMFAVFFDKDIGVMNSLLLKLGWVKDGVNWLGDPWYARLVVSLMIIWKNTGYSLVILMAGFASIPREIYEAAHMDGAGFFRLFSSVALPMLRPVILFLTVTMIIGGFQLFDEAMVLFQGFNATTVVGGPERCCITAVWHLYDTAFATTTNYGHASAIAYGLFVIIAVFSLLAMKAVNRGESA